MREVRRKITPRELQQESEHRFKFFRIKYMQLDEIEPRIREYQQKVNVFRILDNPITTSVELEVIEIVDDG